MTERIQIWTDGACSFNPGPGGWGAILQFRDRELILWGFVPHTTNNQMELTAAIEALTRLRRPSSVDLFTDSEDLKRGIQQWLKRWVASDWKTSRRQAVKNKDLWIKLQYLTEKHSVDWHWVRGHAGHEMNERADSLARLAIQRKKGGEERRRLSGGQTNSADP